MHYNHCNKLSVSAPVSRLILCVATVAAGWSISGGAYAGEFDKYKPNPFVARQISESEVFEEAMLKGEAEGILVGKTAQLMAGKLMVDTPIRMKATKGPLDAKGCQVMFTSMWVRDIPAKLSGKNRADYWFTNKLVICKDRKDPIVSVLSCEFAGSSCMPV